MLKRLIGLVGGEQLANVRCSCCSVFITIVFIIVISVIVVVVC